MFAKSGSFSADFSSAAGYTELTYRTKLRCLIREQRLISQLRALGAGFVKPWLVGDVLDEELRGYTVGAIACGGRVV